ncbi:hypothetical protein H2202_004791 [Exophiala xenobiotica]|nr:hypothetical protein H2202_004791 [Exophiala xenobiotica]
MSTPNKHVIIVGAGLAGLSAASELVSRNVPVAILERQQKPGGNSIKASSGINGVPTRFQVHSADSVESFYNDTIKSVSPDVMTTMTVARQRLISVLTESSASAIHWLADDKGIDLSRVAELGGHSHPRTHRGTGQTPPGASIVTTLLKQLQVSNLAKIETNSTVTKILKPEDEVIGVEVSQEGKTEKLEGPVIFASGGFAGDSTGLLAQHRPDLRGIPSTNEALPGSSDLLTEVGAQLLDTTPKSLLRFIDEMQTRKVVTDAIMVEAPNTTEPIKQWDILLLLDEKTYQETKSHVDFYLWKGLMRKTAISELKHSETALKSIQEYCDIVQGKKSDRLGKTYFGSWTLQDPEPDTVMYVGHVTPVVHYTMGGALFSPEAEVLDSSGRAINGLWAAGEVTGGIHGANRLGGSSLLECVVFGRIAGREAAEYMQTRSK